MLLFLPIVERIPPFHIRFRFWYFFVIGLSEELLLDENNLILSRNLFNEDDIHLANNDLETSSLVVLEESNSVDILHDNTSDLENATIRNTFRCPKCQTVYNAQRNLVRHVRYECGRTRTFKCPYCAYTSCRNNDVTRHLHRKHKLNL